MPRYLEVVIALRGVKPRIWRRFALAEKATFEDLHEAIQDACGWQNYHLFVFNESKGRKAIAGIPDDEYGTPDPDAARVKVSEWIGEEESATCDYLYDFGDSWEHTVRIDRKEHSDRFTRRLLGGGRAFPHEDSGGTPGYERYCSIVLDGKDPYGESVKDALGWLGNWHPDHFDLESAQAKFDRPRTPKKSAPSGGPSKAVTAKIKAKALGKEPAKRSSKP